MSTEQGTNLGGRKVRFKPKIIDTWKEAEKETEEKDEDRGDDGVWEKEEGGGMTASADVKDFIHEKHQ